MSSIAATYQDDAAIQKKRWIILIVLNLFTFMSTLDGSIVNIALPVLVKQLNLPVAQVEWVTTGYLMAICAVILLFGKLGDMLGKIRIFKIGTIVFIIGSMLCGLSTSLPFLIISRVIQAIGASMTMANSQDCDGYFPGYRAGQSAGAYRHLRIAGQYRRTESGRDYCFNTGLGIYFLGKPSDWLDCRRAWMEGSA